MPRRNRLKNESSFLKRRSKDIAHNRADSQSNFTATHRKYVAAVVLLSIFLKLASTHKIGVDLNAISVTVAQFIGLLATGKREAEPSTASEIEKTTEQKIDRFLSWLDQNGARISESVTLSSYSDFGGYGISAIQNHNSARDSVFAVHTYDELFTIPSTLIITSESIIKRYCYVPKLQNRLPQVLRHVPSSLVQQDIIIALHLLVEHGLGEASKIQPYLDILPSNVPRLDTFGNEELSMLQDEELATVARDSYRQLQLVWKNSDLKDILSSMATVSEENFSHKITSTFAPSFKEFHKFVGIVSSRAMLLNGEKHLTPLAGMVNYSPRDADLKRQERQSFALYHQKDKENGSITVLADRNVYAGEQIFEDYGELDNSLYLEAHGFVPDENPFHCAMIHAKYLPSPLDISDSLFEALVALRVFPPSSSKNVAIPDVCVMADGSIRNDIASAYLKIASLMDLRKELGHACIKSIDSLDFEWIASQCIGYPGNEESLQYTIEKSARYAMCDADTSLQEDLSLLDSMVAQERVSLDKPINGMTKKKLAIKFRISDKKILWKLGKIQTFACSTH